MSRIEAIFGQCQQEKRKALTVFISAGNPNIAASEKLALALADAGADIIELGVPFSDPMADGPVIQAAANRALAAGTRLSDIIAMAQRIRLAAPHIPLILFSYYNVILSYGVEKLADDCVKAGIDGWLVVDVPFEESAEIQPILKKRGLSLIPLVAPTTSLERARKIVKRADGFVYYVTVKGVTGVRMELPADLQRKLNALREVSPVPVVAGFGIATPEMAKITVAHADGIVVGSALVRLMNEAKTPESGIARCRELTTALAAALRD